MQPYNIELIGTIDAISGSILFGAGIDLSNSNLQDIITQGISNDTDLILPGSSVIWLLLDNKEINITGYY